VLEAWAPSLASNTRNYAFGVLEPSVAQAPLPLQLFLPACFASPPPCPLQSFLPLQECLGSVGAWFCATRRRPALADGVLFWPVAWAFKRADVPPRSPAAARARLCTVLLFMRNTFRGWAAQFPALDVMVVEDCNCESVENPVTNEPMEANPNLFHP
jgi:hypothetical protein